MSATPTLPELFERIRPRRRILGMSAILLPFLDDGGIDWKGFSEHIERTAQAGLRPAVHMDTGYVQLLDAHERTRVLEMTSAHTEAGFVAGVLVEDRPGDSFDRDGYARRIEEVEAHGGLPIVFPSHGRAALDPDAWVEAHRDSAY